MGLSVWLMTSDFLLSTGRLTTLLTSDILTALLISGNHPKPVAVGALRPATF